MTFAATEVETNHESNLNEGSTEPPANPEPTFDRTDLETALTHSGKTEGIFTAVGVANACQVTDTSVRKALKAFKQVLPEEFLIAENKRLTELAQTLMYQYFRRPDSMTGAEWIYELGQVVGAMPESVVSRAADGSKHWNKVVSDTQKECTSLATTSESMLSRFRVLQDLDDLGDDEAFEAAKIRARELAYQRQIALELAAAEGRAQARADIRKA